MFNDCYSRPDEVMREPALPLYLYSIGEKTMTLDDVSEMGSLKNNFVELIWCVEGTGELTLYEKVFCIQPGDVFFYLPGESHRHRSLSERWRTRWITFDGPLAESYLLAFRYPRLLRGGLTPSDEVFEELKRSISDSDWDRIRKNSGILCQILSNIAIGESDTIHSGQRIKQCIDFILSHLSSPSLDLTMICDLFHLTPSTLNRMFKEKIGSSPGRFIQDRRLQQAQILLLNTDMNISELAVKCGFPDPNTFTRFIRRNLGVSPTAYRKNMSSGVPGMNLKNLTK